MTILSDALSLAKTYDITGQIQAGDRRMHRELTNQLGNQGYRDSLLGDTNRFWFAALKAMGVMYGTEFPLNEVQTIKIDSGSNDDWKLLINVDIFGVGPILTGFIDHDGDAANIQNRIDNACDGGVIPGYTWGDISVTGEGNIMTHPQTVTYSGSTVSGLNHPILDWGPFSNTGTLVIVEVQDGGPATSDPAPGAAPNGQYAATLRDSVENYPSNQIIRQLIKEASKQEGQDWETELIPLLGLDRVASGIQV